VIDLTSLRFILCVVCVALPWLNPITIAPTASVIPFLFSWLFAAVFVLMWQATAQQDHNNNALVRTAALAWLLAALLSSAMGLLQYFGAAAPFNGWINQPALGEAYANLRQRNQFATLTSIGLAALLWWFTQTSKRIEGLPLLLAILAAALLGLGNAASSSRTGMVQIGLLCVLFWLWRGQQQGANRMYLMSTAVVAYIAGVVVLSYFAGPDAGMVGRLRNGDEACSSRIALWSNVLHLVAQKPWWGWGWGELDYAHFITVYEGNRFCDILDNAHNLPLHLAVELGIPAALLFCGLFGWAVWRAKPWREVNPSKQMAWAVLALIALHSLLEYPLWYGPFQIAAAMCVWLIYGRDWHFPIVTAQLLAILIIATGSYALWDYWRVGQIYRPPQERAAAFQENTLEKIKLSWLFKNQVQFAELSVTPLTPANAQHQLVLALEVLHFSPESSVVQRIIDSATLLGRTEDAQWYQARYNAAFEPTR
jgi:O-antigen ligase